MNSNSEKKSASSFWLKTGAFLLVALFIVIQSARYGPSTIFFSILTLLEVLVLFNIMIIVHELGHFLAAKWCGLKIEKFAVWFGHALWSKKIDGVEYRLGSIPFGGFVALPQLAPMETLEGKNEEPKEPLPPASPMQKIIVAFAGPLFSFLLALVFACMVWQVGKPVTYSERTTVIGLVKSDGPAEKAGLRPGDQIVAIDGHAVKSFFGSESIVWRIVSSTGSTIGIDILRDGQPKHVDVTPYVAETSFWQRAPLRQILIGPAQREIAVKEVLPNSPAALAGIQPGDSVIALNGQKLYSNAEVFDQIESHPKDPLTLTLDRAGKSIEATLTAELPVEPKDLKSPMIGISWAEPKLDPKNDYVYPTPWSQISDSVMLIVNTLEALFTPNSHVGASRLSGPVGIMTFFFDVLGSPHGWQLALWLAVVVNVNLAIINLVPFLVLDGGHILLALIEIIRRRPISLKLLEPLQTGFALVLIGYMLWITFFDVQDAGQRAIASDDQIKFAPKSSAP